MHTPAQAAAMVAAGFEFRLGGRLVSQRQSRHRQLLRSVLGPERHAQLREQRFPFVVRTRGGHDRNVHAMY